MLLTELSPVGLDQLEKINIVAKTTEICPLYVDSTNINNLWSTLTLNQGLWLVGLLLEMHFIKFLFYFLCFLGFFYILLFMFRKSSLFVTNIIINITFERK